mmetsp:Transcript_65390/g.80050  ORF Transcript_65390/g.80050 Transcript_65390/m.80050 type:complete len:100 (+) Transcript_65390:1217-1516(+)
MATKSKVSPRTKKYLKYYVHRQRSAPLVDVTEESSNVKFKDFGFIDTFVINKPCDNKTLKNSNDNDTEFGDVISLSRKNSLSISETELSNDKNAVAIAQ